jgi:hypothetical protein
MLASGMTGSTSDKHVKMPHRWHSKRSASSLELAFGLKSACSRDSKPAKATVSRTRKVSAVLEW